MGMVSRQLSLPVALPAKKSPHGGKREGAGRPRFGTGGMPHVKRPLVDRRHPLHVTLRVMAAVSRLRTPRAYRAIRRALVTVANRHEDFRIIHFSIQNNHIHLLVEAETKIALAHGMQGFEISAAKHLNRELGRRRGRVFCDRYHAVAITSVRQTCHALRYVLNNWRRHREDRRTAGLYDDRIDPYSSGALFRGWRERTHAIVVPRDYESPVLSAPRSWMLTEGYKRGFPISVYDVPPPGR